MNGQKRYEELCFLKESVIKCDYESEQSAYYTVTYKDEIIKFCVSDHHSKRRGNMVTIMSRVRNLKKIKRFAWDIREGLNISIH